jgi:hypothetical protein
MAKAKPGGFQAYIDAKKKGGEESAEKKKAAVKKAAKKGMATKSDNRSWPKSEKDGSRSDTLGP